LILSNIWQIFLLESAILQMENAADIPNLNKLKSYKAMIKFTKMHGAGNDYSYVDCTQDNAPSNPADLAVKMSNRNFGIGADGLVLIGRSESADFKMRMFNADGSEAQMCGNAARCIGKFVYDKGLTSKTALTLETLAGIRHMRLIIENGRTAYAEVDMGVPVLAPAEIPVLINAESVVDMPFVFDGREFKITCISMGNPHAVVFVDNTDDWDVQRWGSVMENAPIFPQRCNVEFVEIRSDKEMRMRVWERGSGETLACGTGACAALAAAVLTGRIKCRSANLILLGGILNIKWHANGHIFMTGGAEIVFEGEYYQ
jgi:diaminopimelate epimerase